MKQKVTIEIEAEWGSGLQATSSFDALVVVLQSWRLFYKNKNAGNKIIVKLNGNSIQDIPTKY